MGKSVDKEKDGVARTVVEKGQAQLAKAARQKGRCAGESPTAIGGKRTKPRAHQDHYHSPHLAR